jgi:beta-phosphoglucomutase-like phosphatase (HAD superfamily)
MPLRALIFDVDGTLADTEREEQLPRLRVRAGVAALVDEAPSRGVRLAIVSSSRETQIEALLRQRADRGPEAGV